MAKKYDPVNHDGFSTTGTVAWEAEKGAAKGVGLAVGGGALAGAIPTAIGTGLLATLAGFAIALIPGVNAAAGGYLAGVALVGLIGAGVGAVVGALGGGVAGGLFAGGPLAAIGGMLGIIRGGDRVTKENHAFREHVASRAEGQRHKMAKTFNDGEIEGLKKGYNVGHNDGRMKGRQEGAAMVIHQLQEQQAQEEAMMKAMAAKEGDEKDKIMGKFTAAEASCKCESKVAAVEQQREAAAAAGKSLH